MTIVLPALRGCKVPLMISVGASEPKLLPLLLTEYRSVVPGWRLMVPVKLSNCADVVPPKLKLPERLITLAELPEEKFPEKPLESSPEVRLAVYPAGTDTGPPKNTELPLPGKSKVAPLPMVSVPEPMLAPLLTASVPPDKLILPL